LNSENNHVDDGVPDQLASGFIHQKKLLHNDKRFMEKGIIYCEVSSPMKWNNYLIF